MLPLIIHCLFDNVKLSLLFLSLSFPCKVQLYKKETEGSEQNHPDTTELKDGKERGEDKEEGGGRFWGEPYHGPCEPGYRDTYGYNRYRPYYQGPNRCDRYENYGRYHMETTTTRAGLITEDTEGS